MIDRSFMIKLLTILLELKDFPGGIEENHLFNELNLRSNRAITTELVREHVTLALDKGWIDWKLDMLHTRRYRLTPVGAGQLDDLKNGG